MRIIHSVYVYIYLYYIMIRERVCVYKRRRGHYCYYYYYCRVIVIRARTVAWRIEHFLWCRRRAAKTLAASRVATQL